MNNPLFSFIGNDITEILSKYFLYDQIFDLSHYQTCPEKLHEELSKLTRPCYENNYRFIFLHYEADDYIFEGAPGVALFNLQNILQSLDISNYFCLIISEQDLHKELVYLQKHLTTDDCAIACIQNQLWYCTEFEPQNHLHRQLNPELITKKYISLNLTRRLHRRCILAVLNFRKLFDQGLVSNGGSAPR